MEPECDKVKNVYLMDLTEGQRRQPNMNTVVYGDSHVFNHFAT